MEYLLSKLLPLFIYPVGLAFILGVLALLFGRAGHRARASFFALSALTVLWVSATPIISDTVLGSLESDYPPAVIDQLPVADAVVVLGGSSRSMLDEAADLQFGESIDRLLYALRLYRAGKSQTILLTGGAAEKLKPEAQLAAKFLMEQGIPEEALLLEIESRNTRQNAAYSLEIIKAKNINRILLVTSAFHMRRAQATFERLGMKVTPAATDYRVPERDETVLNWLPDAETLIGTTIGIKEYLGWWFYQWRGWI